MECRRPLQSDLEFHVHEEIGMRITHRNAYSLSIRLQANDKFPESNALIPLYWMKEYFAVGPTDLYTFLQYEEMNFVSIEFTITVWPILLSFLVCSLWGLHRAISFRTLDPNGGKL